MIECRTGDRVTVQGQCSNHASAALLPNFGNSMYFGNPTFSFVSAFGDDTISRQQGFMQDENVACHDIGKLSFERAVGCFGTPQLERATRFPMPQLERATCFAMPQLERATRFPNVPSRVATRDSLLNVPIRTRMNASSKSVYSAGFFLQ